jgi:ribosomal-protein-alanine N-acetyltransferase
MRHDVSADGCCGVQSPRSGDARGQLHVSIRWGLRKDLDAALGIEAGCFDCPWDEREFISHLCQRNCIWYVAESEGRVVGYVVYEIEKTRIRVLNFAIHPRVWRRKVGTAFIAKLTGKLSSERRTHILADVRETNLDAQLFFKAMGFECVGVIEDAYEERQEDAYRFSYRIRDEVFRVAS